MPAYTLRYCMQPALAESKYRIILSEKPPNVNLDWRDQKVLISSERC